jgi:hypothetical protein
MTSPKKLNLAGVVLLVVASIGLAACGEPTRVATLNQTTQIEGTQAATTLQQQLAKQGHPNASVSCTKTIIVNVGPAVTCKLTGAGASGTVQFTFKTLGGQIDLASVKAS